ncbi:AAA family ATPase [Flavobacterium sp. UBA7682]|uniref:AAA family ATPase n=1 Tax=Flavobacterium sp. UBA7682 TaxID=1946560 RepID=UPI0025C0C307|nr:AAA family ATPase [Flavobacterium sp. UBA7682]
MEKITITNFRKVKETWELELAPITFLTGTNNSGKSSVLKALMLIDDFGSSKNHFTLKFNGKNSRNHKIDCFTNAINRSNIKEKNYDIKFSIENKNYIIDYVFYPSEDNDGKFDKGKLKHILFVRKDDGSICSISNMVNDEYLLTIDNAFIHGKYQEDEGFQETDELQAFKKFKSEIEIDLKENESLLKKLDATSTDRIYYLNVVKSLKDKLKDINKRIKNLDKKSVKDKLQFNPTFQLSELDGLESIDRVLRRVLSRYFRENEKNIGLSNANKELFRITILADNILDSLNLNIKHLTPNRNTQTRLYINESGNNDIYELIKVHSENPIDKKRNAAKFLKEWMQRFDIGEDYRIKPIEGLASIIEIKENGDWINLVDKGFGAGQIFAILLRVAIVINERFVTRNELRERRRNRNPIILIEEPEANLHPALQSKLAEFFFEACENFGIQFIVETHSEYLIRKSQLMQMTFNSHPEKRLLKNPFGLYYFEKDDSGPYKMEYLESGYFDKNFGEGFYDEASKHTMQLIQNNRLKG